MSDFEIALLLEALRSERARDGWVVFLGSYSTILYQTARAATSSEDAASDCYLYICEQLARNQFRRLLKFDPRGKATFATWLRVVARNLCYDWHRGRSGRPRPFKSVQRLSPLEMEIYNLRLVRGASQQETLRALEPVFPGVSLAELCDIEERLQRSLSSRQQWLLSTRKQPEFTSTVAVAGEEEEPRAVEVVDRRPNPEVLFANRQLEAQLRKRIADLPAEERLLVHLRFEEDLSLDEIARLCKLGDAQRAHRKLAAVLTKLRTAVR